MLCELVEQRLLLYTGVHQTKMLSKCMAKFISSLTYGFLASGKVYLCSIGSIFEQPVQILLHQHEDG